VPPLPSAGVLLYRRANDTADADNVEVLIGHMGGPFWARRDAGGWSVPKGEHEPDEEPLAAAQREFAEELGLRVPADDFVALGSVTTSRGKVIRVWAAEGDLDVTTAVSNTFTLEWPRGSGTTQEFPELDRVAWTPVSLARGKLVASQVPFLERLLAVL
jgi:predicted NUDIX family NTP pyrophosphohydrolase